MQEVYDKGTLHRLLGLGQPKPLVNGHSNGAGPSSGSARLVASASVLSAWGEADMDVSSDEGARADPGPGRRRPRHSDESDSRYDVGAPARKRRRTGKPQDAHTVFTTDEEDELDERARAPRRARVAETASAKFVDEDSLDEEELAYDSDVQLVDPEAKGMQSTVNSERRRAFWASKGLNDVDSS